jgi:transcription termination factor Rho
VTKAELESKHLAELHALAAEAGVPRYRMLRRDELVEKLAAGERESKPRQRRERKPRQRREPGERRERRDRPRTEPKAEGPAPPRREEREGAGATEPTRPRRRRGRRRFGRKRKELRLQDVLMPATGGQAIAYAETAEGCTALLRELAAELAGESKGSDPVAVLVDPGPEELAEWRREAPQAEIVAAAQTRHADDAIAQAARRAESGEDVVVLIDSLTRLAEKFGDAEAARGLLEAAGPVTVVAALERR